MDRGGFLRLLTVVVLDNGVTNAGTGMVKPRNESNFWFVFVFWNE
jgi:hypothetical protein